MTWDPPGLWASLILSISGGIAAGVLVLLGQIAIRWRYDHRQQKKGAKAIGLLFSEWETTINEAADIPSGLGTLPAVPRANVQHAENGEFMRRAANLIERWQRFLTAEQVEEISNHLEQHQAVLVALRGGLLQQIHYDDFFLRAREVKWLDYGWTSDVKNS